jgi:hypothetical protein
MVVNWREILSTSERVKLPAPLLLDLSGSNLEPSLIPRWPRTIDLDSGIYILAIGQSQLRAQFSFIYNFW